MSFPYGDGVGQSSIAAIEGLAAKSGIALQVTSTYRPGGPYHGTSNAVDFSNGGNAGTPEMDAFAAWWETNFTPYLLELIHVNQDGSGTYVKNGQQVAGGFFGAATLEQHHNHVHVAATNAGIAAANGGGATPAADGTVQATDTSLVSSNLSIFHAAFWERAGIGAAGILTVFLGFDFAKRGLNVK